MGVISVVVVDSATQISGDLGDSGVVLVGVVVVFGF